MTRKHTALARIFSVVVLLLSGTLVVAQNPVPFINQPLVPDAIALAPNGLTFALIVNGTGFVPTSTVNWNGSPRTSTPLSRSILFA